MGVKDSLVLLGEVIGMVAIPLFFASLFTALFS